MQPISLESLLGLMIIIGLGLIGLKARALSLSGLIAGVVVGYVVFIGGGWSWFILMVLFFLIASQCTRYRYEHKRSLGAAQEKGGARGWQNTLANGGVAAALAMGERISALDFFSAMFLGAVSAAMSDTLATELGLLSRSKPRLITDLRRQVPAGTSGAITPLGLFVSLLAPLIVGVGGFLLSVAPISLERMVILSVVGGFVGSVTDSLIGASVQGMNRCVVCNSLTEELRHHGRATITVRGLRLVDNNVVNLLSTIVGAIVALLIFMMV